MTQQTGSDQGRETAAEMAAVRAWFDREGWTRQPTDLRHALQERGASDDLIVELIDEGADRRRSKAEQARKDAPLAYTPSEHVLASLLLAGGYGAEMSTATLERVRGAGLTVAMFARERDQLIYQSICTTVDQGDPAEWLLVERDLAQSGRLDRAGGRGYLLELAKMAPAVENAAAYARLVIDEAHRHDLERVGLLVTEAARNGGVSTDLRDLLVRLVEQPHTAGPPPEAVGGGAFVFDEPTNPADIRIWGADEQIGWSAGEGLMLLGPDGVGKTTIGQQLALARAGLRDHVLGMHVTPDPRRVLYIAADRPRQAARSLRRMLGPLERNDLDDRVTVWRGPLPAMLNEDRTILTRLAKTFDAGTVIIDSLKDVAVDLAKDEAGGRIAAAFQHLIANNVELLVLHHPRKPEVGQHRPPRELTDAYGSRLIYGVMGSVIVLWGNPGDTIIELRHLKQPVEEIGPWTIRHDHQHGRSEIERGTDLLDLVLHTGTTGLTAPAAASLVYSKAEPTRNETDRVRKRLDKLARDDKIVKIPGRSGGHSGAENNTTYVFNGPKEALT